MKKRIEKKLRKKRLETLNELSALDQKLGLYDEKPDWISYGTTTEKADPDFMSDRPNIAAFDENDSKN